MDKAETITIEINEYLDPDLSRKIVLAQWQSDDPKKLDRLRRLVFDGKTQSDCFHVLAFNSARDVVGRIYCLQNQTDPKLWLYGDLFVVSDYRRMGIATKLLHAAMKAVAERGGERLRCYVAPDNTPSQQLQRSLGFLEKPFAPFDDLVNEGELLFERPVPGILRAVPATLADVAFVWLFYTQNQESLHEEELTLQEWKEILSKEDPDEQNFLVCKGIMPVAWLRVSGLAGKDMAWLSMLAVGSPWKWQGVGTYAVEFAETFALQRGFSRLGVRVTKDNFPARNLCEKLGYVRAESQSCKMRDGSRQRQFTFIKEIG